MSLVAGLALTASVIIYAWAWGKTGNWLSHTFIHTLLILEGGISAIVLIIQLLTGPFVFTKKTVCQLCHREQTIAQFPFLPGRVIGYQNVNAEETWSRKYFGNANPRWLERTQAADPHL